jgi:shikimate kinase
MSEDPSAATPQAEAAAPVPEGVQAVPGSIFLVGMMGAGKTSVGKALARELGKTFVDSDHVIEERTGVRIPVIFDLEGEAGFRAREAAVIDELTAQRDVVLATGGGAVLSEANRQLLHARGTVVYLRASVPDLWHRTKHDRNRPLLQTADPLARLTELHAQRDPLYRAVAHLVVDTGSQSLRTLVLKLRQKLAQGCATAAAAGQGAEACGSG